jgi:hypothetical protein
MYVCMYIYWQCILPVPVFILFIIMYNLWDCNFSIKLIAKYFAIRFLLHVACEVLKTVHYAYFHFVITLLVALTNEIFLL